MAWMKTYITLTALLGAAMALPSNTESNVARAAESPVLTCETVLCKTGYSCKEVDGKPTCVPGTRCGPNVCEVGEVCCNYSCGICTPPDGVCITLWCGDNDLTVDPLK